MSFIIALAAGCRSSDPVDETGETGGETGDAVLPDAPFLALSFNPIKQFDFVWAATTHATYYELFERADAGADSILLATDLTTEALTVTMPLHLRAGARYELQACNSAGCTASEAVQVDSMAEAVGYFKPSSPALASRFGSTIALSGDGTTLVVGAPLESSAATGIDGDQTDGSASAAGAVYVFVRDAENQWSQQAYVKASNTDANDGFGSALALSGDGSVLAVGTAYEDSAATGTDGDPSDNSAPASGAVYVFERDESGSWTQRSYVKASNTDANDGFGVSVALADDGQTLAVGASDEASGGTGVDADPSDDSAGGSGAVYVFHRDPTDGWIQQAYIKASNAEGADFFGRSVALSADGSVLAAGADGESSNATGVGGDESDNSDPGAGAAYVFRRAGTSWSQEAYVKSEYGNNEHLGTWLGLSDAGDMLLISSFDREVIVVEHRPSGWGWASYFSGDQAAISGDGTVLAVGRPWESSNATGIGGDPTDDSVPESGAVDVFVWESEMWMPRGYVKAPNTDAGDHFGTSVALSGTGTTLAVGAPDEASIAVGIGGDQGSNLFSTGAVYLY